MENKPSFVLVKCKTKGFCGHFIDTKYECMGDIWIIQNRHKIHPITCAHALIDTQMNGRLTFIISNINENYF